LALILNNKAKLELHLIELLGRTNWNTVCLAFPGVSRASASRWKRSFIDSDRKLFSLLPK